MISEGLKKISDKQAKKGDIVIFKDDYNGDIQINKQYILEIFNRNDEKVTIKDPDSGNILENIDLDDNEGYFYRKNNIKSPTDVKSNMFDILVLPKDIREMITTTINQAHQDINDRIFKQWGFDSTIEKGKGIILLFFGIPGTGKTMCAESICGLLGRDYIMLGNKDLQSSSPGEMERNIVKAFNDAKSKKAILILDECDSLVYNRDEVGSILGSEINCLLTEIERFEGICILTTNRSERLDPALERRVCLKVEFKKPNKEMRKLIWRNLIPKQAPLSKCVRFDKLSKFDLTGGQIKNCILTGARVAATRNKGGIKYEDLVKGIKMELMGEKMWKNDKYNNPNQKQVDFAIGTSMKRVIRKEKEIVPIESSLVETKPTEDNNGANSI